MIAWRFQIVTVIPITMQQTDVEALVALKVAESLKPLTEKTEELEKEKAKVEQRCLELQSYVLEFLYFIYFPPLLRSQRSASNWARQVQIQQEKDIFKTPADKRAIGYL